MTSEGASPRQSGVPKPMRTVHGGEGATNMVKLADAVKVKQVEDGDIGFSNAEVRGYWLRKKMVLVFSLRPPLPCVGAAVIP